MLNLLKNKSNSNIAKEIQVGKNKYIRFNILYKFIKTRCNTNLNDIYFGYLMTGFWRYRNQKWRWKINRKSNKVWKLRRIVKQLNFGVDRRYFNLSISNKDRIVQNYVVWKFKLNYDYINKIKLFNLNQNRSQNSLIKDILINWNIKRKHHINLLENINYNKLIFSLKNIGCYNGFIKINKTIESNINYDVLCKLNNDLENHISNSDYNLTNVNRICFIKKKKYFPRAQRIM